MKAFIPLNHKRCAAIALLMTAPALATAGELIYQPINPSFGGDPFMGSHLLNKAQAQDTNTDPNVRRREPLSATERLVQRLESQLVSQLLSEARRGEISEGNFDSDDFGIIVSDENGELAIQVTDKLTGDTTTIRVGSILAP